MGLLNRSSERMLEQGDRVARIRDYNFSRKERVARLIGQQGKVVYLLLCGGTKASQQDDIEMARKIWSSI